jgi:endonuclease G
LAGTSNPIDESPHVALGIPRDSDPSDDLLIDEHQFVVSYNPTRNDPNWVSWRLQTSDLGVIRRRNDFRADPQLPFNVYHVTPEDYLRAGFDRGHLCPSADRTGNARANSTTFLMTNMEPQLHELNAGPWEKLEAYERQRAAQGHCELFIIAGGIFDAHPATIGHGVAVPRASFKIIVEMPVGRSSAADVGPDTEPIAVIMPNDAGVGRHPWTHFLTSVREIERETGYDFLPNVRRDVQEVIEQSVARTQVAKIQPTN